MRGDDLAALERGLRRDQVQRARADVPAVEHRKQRQREAEQPEPHFNHAPPPCVTAADLRTVQDLAADEIQIQQAEDEVEPRHPDQREQHVSRADDVAVAVLRAKQPVDQPGLAAKLRRHPAGGVRDERKRERQHQHPEERTTRLQPSAEALKVGEAHQRR